MKIYTKTGDKGTTSLVGGKRVSKSHPRLETYGGLDELNASLGVALSHISKSSTKKDCWQLLFKVQHQLFNMGSRLACEDPEMLNHLPTVSEALITDMENLMDEMNTQLPELKQFILPGGSSAAAHLHFSRTLCRRVERRLVSFYQQQTESAVAAQTIEVQFLNRLSDYLFVAARYANSLEGLNDVFWQKEV